MKRVLIMGSTGFIGQRLAAELSQDRELLLTGFGRAMPKKLNGNIRFIQGSIEDTNKLESAVKGQDIVYHLISQSIPSSSWEYPALEIEKNLTPSIRLIELAAAAGVKKICFASSGGTVYGMNDAVLTEVNSTDPFSPYGIVKRTLENILTLPERNPFLRGMRAWVGFRQIAVPYEREARVEGKSGYTFAKLAKIGADGIFSFSKFPIRIITFIGFIGLAVAVTFSILLVALYFSNEVEVRGYTTLALLISFFGSLNLICLGVIGEYIARPLCTREPYL